ncbi:MAG: peptide ABC transporter substrate-binding protein [Candidatus Limnocylindrales bacterium]
MTSRDRAVVLALVAVFAIFTVAVGVPAATPPSTSSPPASSIPGGTPGLAVYREGILGRPGSIDPLTAKSQADRDLVALVFSGLVRLGPDGTVVPDLAASWTVDKKGASYTFQLRPDARWQDGQPVTSADVLYTIHALQDPSYTGPGASSWREVTVTAIDDLTVRFDLATPLGSFLQAATQPLLPDHLLHDVNAADLDESSFNNAPVGSGPYRLVTWDALEAHLEFDPATAPPAPTAEPSPSAAPSAAAPSSTAAAPSSAAASHPASSASPPAGPSASPSPTPTAAPTPPVGSVQPEAVDVRFYNDAASLMTDYRAGLLDAASGLMSADATTLASTPGSRLVEYPRTTYTGIVLNLRPGHPLFQDATVRKAFLQAIDRPSLIATVLGDAGTTADTPIPPSSWAYDAKAAPPVAYDPAAATKALKKAGWTLSGGAWRAPKSKQQLSLELITPDQDSNPLVYATTQAVAEAWTRFGIKVSVIALTPHDFVDKRLAPGRFDAATVDVDVGLDPDLYPFLASTQTTTGGANVSGVQSLDLDKKLVAARRYGTATARLAAFRDLQAYLGQATLTLPLFFREEPVVLTDRVWGPTAREIADPSGRYWDVLTWRLANGP